jgi:hypothetical protein
METGTSLTYQPALIRITTGQLGPKAHLSANGRRSVSTRRRASQVMAGGPISVRTITKATVYAGDSRLKAAAASCIQDVRLSAQTTVLQESDHQPQ